MMADVTHCAEHGEQPRLVHHPLLGLSGCAACLDAIAAQPLRFTILPTGRVGVEKDAESFVLRWPHDSMKSLGFPCSEVP